MHLMSQRGPQERAVHWRRAGSQPTTRRINVCVGGGVGGQSQMIAPSPNGFRLFQPPTPPKKFLPLLEFEKRAAFQRLTFCYQS